MAVEIFISYSRNDPDSVSLSRTLRDELRTRHGHEVFVDVEMAAGVEWKKELERNIESSDVFLLLISAPSVDSYEVLEELRYALFLHRERKRPRILPVLVNCDLPEGEIKVKVGPIQYLLWHSQDDTPGLVAGIQKGLVARRKRRLIRASLAAAATLAATLFVLFLRHQLAILNDVQSSEPSAVHAYRWLKAANAFALPRLWLRADRDPRIVMRGYFERSAEALDREANGLFDAGEREQRRDKIDEGLMKAALAAVKRGAAPSARARAVYDAQHYGRLLTTIREPAEVPGVGLAVSAGPAQWRIAAGGHIWTCTLPLGEAPCELTAKSILNAVTTAVFKSDDEVYLVENSGRSTHLRLSDKAEQRRQAGVLNIAEDDGEIATAYEVHAATDPSVIIDGADEAQERSPNFGAIAALSFGPCTECLSLLGENRKASVWRRGARTPVALGSKRAVAIAATRAGLVAVIWDDGYLELFSAQFLASPGPAVDFRGATAMAMSNDGRSIAVVRDGAIRLSREANDLITAELTPTSVAAVFSGNGTLVTRTPRDVRIWRPVSPKDEKLAPDQLHLKWRKQLGFFDINHFPWGYGWDSVAGDVRRY